MKRHSHATRHHVLRTRVPGVRLHHLAKVNDPRGDLCAGEFLRDVPFTPKRFFLIFKVPSGKIRGEHAHKKCRQFLVCMSGALTVSFTDGRHRQAVRLERLGHGVYVPPGVWCRQENYSRDAVLLVFASDYYDPNDYIRNYAAYLQWKRPRPSKKRMRAESFK